MSKTILTGIRTNDVLHIGNYFGGIAPMVHTQKGMKPGDRLMMFVPDLHSFTTPIDHSGFYRNILDTVKMFLAGGVDPNQKGTLLYRQSRIAAHSEMAWILNCFTYFGEASRMTEFKDKSSKLSSSNVSIGLFAYPTLMAADILLYDAEYVPVGEDQKQHMELARKLALRLNHKFGQDLLVVPKPWAEQLKFSGRDRSIRIRSLSQPQQKMSKSILDPKGTISLLDIPDEAYRKVLSATTDSLSSIRLDFDNQPGISNLLQLLALFTEQPLDKIVRQWQGKTNYGELKKTLAPLIRDFLIDFQAKFRALNDGDVEKLLLSGESEAQKIAQATLKRVKVAIGLEKAQ